jgi:Fe-S cluster assembly protein SufB
MAATEQTIKQVNSLGNSEYKYGFSTELDEIKAPKGLSEEVVRFISAQKNEPDWMLEWRLNAFKVFNKLITKIITITLLQKVLKTNLSHSMK